MNRRPERFGDLLPGVLAGLVATHTTVNGEPPMKTDDCEVTPLVNHDARPTEYAWDCTCGAAEGGFTTWAAGEESSDRHLDAGSASNAPAEVTA